jgi:hypothetical protein
MGVETTDDGVSGGLVGPFPFLLFCAAFIPPCLFGIFPGTTPVPALTTTTLVGPPSKLPSSSSRQHFELDTLRYISLHTAQYPLLIYSDIT